MANGTPRLRMFAGPNGSGKTTIKTGLRKSSSWFGLYINPDDMEKMIRASGRFSLRELGIDATADQVCRYLQHSTFLQSRQLADAADRI